MDYLIEKYGELSVYWEPELDGGGRSFGQQFVPVVQNMVGRVQRVFEFCAGPGFIGFSLLANGLCDTLCLADVSPRAVKAALKTVRENGLSDRVTVYLSDCLSSIPSHETWDLAVGNAPHFCGADDAAHHQDIIRFDPGWRIHKAFYRDVRRFLRPHGSVILLENYSGSSESVFAPFIRQGDLELVDSFMCCVDEPWLNTHYFLWSRPVHAGIVRRDRPPSIIRVAVSELKEKPMVRHFEGCEKVRLEIINDVDYEVKIGLQTRSNVPDQVIRSPQRAKKISEVFLVPAGSLHVINLTDTVQRICTCC